MEGRSMTMKRSSADKLPPEILTEVLATLPVKTLLKFRCVCKSWRSLIDHPDFFSIHLSHSHINHEKLHIISLDMTSPPSDQGIALTLYSVDKFRSCGETVRFPMSGMWRTTGHVNGLLLIWRLPGPFSKSNPGELILLNPSIRKSLTLPPCPHGSIFDMNLLGFDPSTNDYNVAVLDPHGSRVAIYELSKGSWRTKTIDFVHSVYAYWTKGYVSLKSSVHWVSKDNEDPILVSFDFATESFSYIDLPSDREDYVGTSENRRLFVVRDLLAVYDIDDEGECCIWVLRNDEWLKWHSICFKIRSSVLHLFYVERRDMFFVDTTADFGSFTLKSNHKRVLQKSSHRVFERYMDTYIESLALAGGFQNDG